MSEPIYVPKARAREYGDMAINIYTGCNHGCSYCFAPHVLHKSTDVFSQVEPRAGIVDAVKQQLIREKITGKLIHLCFVCDPYPADVDTTPTREIIEAIKSSGNHVQILTKGGYRALRDFDLLDHNDRFGVTITSFGSWSEEHEPKAAPGIARLRTLEIAKHEGIMTWVSLEPTIFPKVAYHLIEQIDYIDLYKIGKLNYQQPPEPIDWGKYGRECERLCRKHNREYYIKDDLRKEMAL